jgi:ChrR-like protein with cupin domain
MSTVTPGRRVARIDDPFLSYDLEGPLQPDIGWLPISYDKMTGQGCYLMRMQPGAAVLPHRHPGMEEFLILEGDLIDSDGRVFSRGDFVSYDAARNTIHAPSGAASSPFSSGASPPDF